MRVKTLLTILCLALGAVTAAAQSTTGTISGRVVDAQGLSVPGVTITATSTNLQGPRETVSSENGDYILTLLPPGQYVVVFELSGFQRQQRVVTVAPTQVVPLEVELGVAQLEEAVQVVARAADVLVNTAQVATNFSEELLSTLPTNRDIRSTLLMAPAAHPTGPAGGFSLSGSMSFETLFMVNGVSVSEMVRGQPLDLIIEDAVQESTVATAGISAEYGRFGGGVVNVITKSGGNTLAGTFRTSMTNDDWRSLVPRREGDTFANDSKIDDIVPLYEYTAGGAVIRDRLWFFTAGRFQTDTFNRQTNVTNVPYTFKNKTERYEAKLTYSLDANHKFQGAYTKIARTETNQNFGTILDLASLYDRDVPEDLLTINYTGVLTPSFFLEGRYSQRNLTFIGSGSTFTDIQKGTLLVDLSGRRYHAPTFCGICTDEQRDNQDLFLKGSYFLSTSDTGSHNLVFGYDLFNDKRFANNYQSGSNYRFTNAPAVPDGTNLIATFVSGSTRIQWDPIFVETEGTNFRTHSVFVNDNWRVTERLTANLGVRWDRNDGSNSVGQVVAKQGAISPRFGVVFDPKGDGRWSVTASAAKYVAGLQTTIADVASPGGNADSYRFLYRGPDINVGPGPKISNEAAIQQVFDWFNANGGATLPLVGAPDVRGVSPQIGNSLSAPSVWEYASGVTRQYGARATVRADFIYRNYGNFYIRRTDLSTGRAVDTRSFAPASVQGREYDLALIENDKDGVFDRQYAGLTLQGQYRMGTRMDFGANYTLSRAWGNIEGETGPNGPITAGEFGREAAYFYPEYRRESWNYPEGDLTVDQRHRARLWVNYTPPVAPGLTLSVLQALESGTPYSASNQNASSLNGVDARPFLANPGYVNPPDGANTQYYFTARDAFRLEGQKRTDFAARYDYDLSVRGNRRLGLFFQAQVINLFNQFQLCGCGGSGAFPLGGNVNSANIETGIRTNVSTPATYQTFNPFTTTPVEGVHWDKAPGFGHALNRFAYTTPRTFRMTFGLKF